LQHINLLRDKWFGQGSTNEQPDDTKNSVAGSREDVRREDLETEFTRDFYRLVKFESNRSLASSEKFDQEDVSPGLPPPDRQVSYPSHCLQINQISSD